jgi:hypothetical protein
MNIVFSRWWKDVSKDLTEPYSHVSNFKSEGTFLIVIVDGQTGSGKTHSIMGNNVGGEEEDADAGIIPRALKHMFHTLNQHLLDGKTMASIRVSMIEIYNDECRDLLHPEIPSRDVMIREDKHGRIFFTGAREEVVNNSRVAIQFLQQGNLNRTTAETLMNQTSSRSHAIFTISLEMIEYQVNRIPRLSVRYLTPTEILERRRRTC